MREDLTGQRDQIPESLLVAILSTLISFNLATYTIHFLADFLVIIAYYLRGICVQIKTRDHLVIISPAAWIQPIQELLPDCKESPD